jgi:putative ABC transport system permease protein
MSRILHRKLLNDLRLSKARTFLMVIAVAVSLFGIGTVLGAYGILTREISRNYLETNPASATLELDRTDEALVAAVRRQPGIAEAEARASVQARVKVGPDWRPLLLFVVRDFDDLRVAKFRSDQGAWPPPAGTMLIERTAVRVLEGGVGQRVEVKTPHGRAREVTVSGLVHDPALAPAWMERTVYAYCTPATLELLGEPTTLDELKIVAAGSPTEAQAVEDVAQNLARWLQAQGRSVWQIQVPPPRRHPHQGQMEGILFLLAVFAGMALGLSAILVATLIDAMLASQVRQIGVMKTVGARTSTIVRLYLSMVLLIGLAALALAAAPSVVAGRGFAKLIADMLNFAIGSQAISGWVFVVQAAAAVLVPLLVAAVPIVRGSLVSVRQAIDDHGVAPEAFGQRRLDAWLSGLRGWNRTLMLALRNSFRRRGRLILALILLGVGGGMFMTALGLTEAWRLNLAEVTRTRHYDVEIRFNEPEPVAPLLARLRGVPGVRDVEAWGYTQTARSRPGLIDVVRTYPDRGHASFAILAPPASTRLVGFPVLAGRWLRPDDSDAVVVNQRVPGVHVGETLALSIAGRATSWKVVGIVEEVGSASAAYVTDEAFARAAGTEGRAKMLRIVSSATDPESRVEVIRRIEQALDEAGASVAVGMPLAELRTAVGDHIEVLVRALLAMALLMATVGALGLLSTMSMNVIERTRELGVLHAIGATPGVVRRIVVAEGLFVGLLSWLVAIVVALPLSAVVGGLVGRLSFNVSLPLVLSPEALAVWLVLLVAVSAAATAVPAWRASRLTVREALAYA